MAHRFSATAYAAGGCGTKIITIPQTMGGMSPAMKELERLLREGEMTHERNPCGRWAFGNVVVAQDGNENIKPMKTGA